MFAWARKWWPALIVAGFPLLWAGLRFRFDRDVTTEYGGQCGLARVCVSRYWGLSESCGPPREYPGFVAFATAADCGTDWQPMARCSYAGLQVSCGSSHRLGRPIAQLQELRRVHRSNQAEYGKYVPVEDGAPAGWSPAHCGDRANFVSDAQYSVVWVRQPDAGTQRDCWALDESGVIRHLTRD